jgi:hypothetical protein
MDSAIKRLSKDKIRELSEQLSTMRLRIFYFYFLVLECHASENQSKKHRIVIALASLLYKAKDMVESRITSITAMGLVEILEKGGSQHVTAISLLGDGFDIWRYCKFINFNLKRHSRHSWIRKSIIQIGFAFLDFR